MNQQQKSAAITGATSTIFIPNPSSLGVQQGAQALSYSSPLSQVSSVQTIINNQQHLTAVPTNILSRNFDDLRPRSPQSPLAPSANDLNRQLRQFQLPPPQSPTLYSSNPLLATLTSVQPGQLQAAQASLPATPENTILSPEPSPHPVSVITESHSVHPYRATSSN